MLIAAVLCLCAAAAIAGLGLWLLARPIAADPVRQVLRAVAPTQLAAAVMLTAGGVVALSAQPQTGLIVVVVCAVGAVCTVACRMLAERQGGRAPRGRRLGPSGPQLARGLWRGMRDLHAVL